MQFTDEEIAALAAYVASLAPGPAIPSEDDYDYADADVAEGGEIYRTNCAMCHNYAGSGGALTRGKFAPSLKGVEPKHMYEAMLTGPQSMPVFGDDTMTPEAKRDIIAFLKTSEAEPSPGGLSLGKIGPVSEGAVGWVLAHRRARSPAPSGSARRRGGPGPMSDQHHTTPDQPTGSAPAARRRDAAPVELETRYENPGITPHAYRRSDIDPKAAKRREREVAALFGLSTLGTLLFIVGYFAVKLDRPRRRRRCSSRSGCRPSCSASGSASRCSPSARAPSTGPRR